MGVFKSFGMHLGQRFYAFDNGFFRTQDAKETAKLYEQVIDLFQERINARYGSRNDFMVHIMRPICREVGIDSDHPRIQTLCDLVSDLILDEGLFVLPDIDLSERRSTSQWWELRDELLRQKALVEELDETKHLIEQVLIAMIKPVCIAVPDFVTGSPKTTDLTVPTNLVSRCGDARAMVQAMVNAVFDPEVVESELFAQLRTQLKCNHVEASGGDPADIEGFQKTIITVERSKITNPQELVGTYLKHTALEDFLDQKIDFAIPTKTRFEHHHMVAGSGHGKTQTLQYLIANDLEAVAKGERSIVVLDSQGDLIRNIANLREFAPGGLLHDRVVIIDPTDVEYPVSLNLFDVGIERLSGYAPLERERLTNSILELYDFVLGTLLDAQMTQKQNVIFRYVTRLMLHIPNATIHTLRELMEPDSHITFAEHIQKLEGSAKHFFETEFKDKEFAGTRKQVLRRLWGILENQTFERMFSHPKSKLDLFGEMNAGKVILINTAKDLLKETGSQIFGRFFIALIAQAAQERATLPEGKRLPTFVYIDEAQDYFDRNIGLILAQARKYNVGMVLAHQYLGQLDPKLQDAFAANTSIKFAGGVSAKDARMLAPMLHCEPALIEAQAKGSFASFVRGETKGAVPLTFPLGYLEKKEAMSFDDKQNLKDLMRERYAVHHSALRADIKEAAEENDCVQDASKNTTPADIDLTPGTEW